MGAENLEFIDNRLKIHVDKRGIETRDVRAFHYSTLT